MHVFVVFAQEGYENHVFHSARKLLASRRVENVYFALNT